MKMHVYVIFIAIFCLISGSVSATSGMAMVASAEMDNPPCHQQETTGKKASSCCDIDKICKCCIGVMGVLPPVPGLAFLPALMAAELPLKQLIVSPVKVIDPPPRMNV